MKQFIYVPSDSLTIEMLVRLASLMLISLHLSFVFRSSPAHEFAE